MDGVDAAAAIRREADVSIVFIAGYRGSEARDPIGQDIRTGVRPPNGVERTYRPN